MACARVIWLVLLVIVFCAACEGSVCDTRGTANGCSTPGKIPFFYKSKFTPACNKHDHCYNCGVRLNIHIDVCDGSFYRNMLSICNRESRWTRWICKKFALSYFGAVRAVGSRYWMKTSKSYCTESWVRGCVM